MIKYEYHKNENISMTKFIACSLYDSNKLEKKCLWINIFDVLVIDEISMVSSALLYQVNMRLNEIFGYSGELPFAGFYIS